MSRSSAFGGGPGGFDNSCDARDVLMSSSFLVDSDGFRDQGCQNRDFAAGQKRRAKSTMVKSQPTSNDFTQLL